MDNYEKSALCALHSIKGLGNRSLWHIKSTLGSFELCLRAESDQLKTINLSPEVINEILNIRQKAEQQKQWQIIREKGFDAISFEDESYPRLLRNISNPPYILYAKGDITLADNLCLAVVGSRTATTYGKMAARKFGLELVQNNTVVVSGMARGIDTEAQLGALEGNGHTIAVLGSGLDVIYPRENTKMFNQICETGLVFSEYPLGTAPEPGNFPARNRIISGLSRGVIVIEAMEKSGALITVDFALEQGRDVFAVPGPINSKTSVGTNNLIKQGAKLVTSVEDVLEEYFFNNESEKNNLKQQKLLMLDNNEEMIVECIESQSKHFDCILEETGLDIGMLSTLLLKLEFEGIIKSLPGNSYIKIF